MNLHSARSLTVVALLLGCDSAGKAPPDVSDEVSDEVEADPGSREDGWYLSAEPQREGEPSVGFALIAAGEYVGCGLPMRFAPAFYATQGLADLPRLPGAEDPELPYFASRVSLGAAGEIAVPNCFFCHAGKVNGELVLGAPSNGEIDFGLAAAQAAAVGAESAALRDALPAAERPPFDHLLERMAAVAPYVQADTAGVNPADNVAAILMAHRDPVTMAWSVEPRLEPPPTYVLPVDVPAWWNLKWKHSMFHTAAGRGDHAQIMMASSILCIDDVERARAIADWFADVRAYIVSIQAPKWPFGVDQALADEGRIVYQSSCARCHGTYDGASPHYPNLWFEADVVGTDPALATGSGFFVNRFVDWFAESFFAPAARLEPKPGYIAPPLEGIWASGPYFHNGSVPTVAQVIDSATRPTYWRRSFDSHDYDKERLGPQHEALAAGKDSVTDAADKRLIYDTTMLGYGNGGHTFGDDLPPAARAALLEYLKTL